MVCGRYFLLRRHALCHWWTACLRLVYAPERGTGSVCSVALLLNLVLYTLSILVIAPVTIALYPGVFLGFSLPARCFIAIGAIMQLALAGLFLLLLVRPGLVERWPVGG